MTLTEAIARQPADIRPIAMPVATSILETTHPHSLSHSQREGEKAEAGERFAILQPKAMPEFGFLVREDAEPRFGWEAWLTIRDTHTRVRIASGAGELDGIALDVIAPALTAACQGLGVVALFVQHARTDSVRSSRHAASSRLRLTRLGMTIEASSTDSNIVDLADYPLTLLARYGTEVIAEALAWIDFDAKWCDRYGTVRGPLRPCPITIQNLSFLECHIAHLERDLETRRRFRR